MKKITLKKFMFFTILSMVSSVTTFAQKGANIEIIINPGFSMGSEIDVPKTWDYQNWTAMGKSYTFGINTGISFEYNFNEKIGISIGMLYSKNGQKYKDYLLTINSTQTTTLGRNISLNYLKIPFQLNCNTAPNKNISFMLSAGFYVGFLLSYNDESNNKYSNGGTYSSSSKGETFTETYNFGTVTTNNYHINDKPYKSTDFGGLFGLGLQFKISEKVFLPLVLNYQIGFSDIKNTSSQIIVDNQPHLFWNTVDKNNNPNATLSFRNSFLGLNIGLKIKL